MPFVSPGNDSVDISVLIPVRDRADMLKGCLQSVRAQCTTARFEVVVVDDASSDDSAEVAEAAGARVVRNPENLGCGASRNVGLGRVRGAWTAFVDSDDWWSPFHLQSLWDMRHDVGLVVASAITFSPRVQVVGSPYPWPVRLSSPADVLSPDNIVSVSAAMASTGLLECVGGFSTRRYADDLDTWTRLLARKPGIVLPILTVGYRSHEGQLSGEPGMSAGSEELFECLARSSVLEVRHRKALEAAVAWDGGATLGAVPRLRRVMRLPEASLPALSWVLAARALRRHRWRLHHREVERIAGAAGSPVQEIDAT